MRRRVRRRWLSAVVLVIASGAGGGSAPSSPEIVSASISTGDVFSGPIPDAGTYVLAPSVGAALSGLLPGARGAPIGPRCHSTRPDRTRLWTFAAADPDRSARDPEFRASAALARGGALSAPSTAPPTVPLLLILVRGSAASVS